jgi:hypothetical protein
LQLSESFGEITPPWARASRLSDAILTNNRFGQIQSLNPGFEIFKIHFNNCGCDISLNAPTKAYEAFLHLTLDYAAVIPPKKRFAEFRQFKSFI